MNILSKEPKVFFRFYDKVLVGDGCWEWKASLRDGYGQFKLQGRMTRSHCVAWRMWNGDIPPDKWVLHHCDNRKCVRIDHLYLGTPLDNARDASVRGRLAQARKTHCPQGHPYGPYVPGGIRACSICRKAISAKHELKRRNGMGKGWRRQVTTACPQGHPYDEANTYWYRGLRYCRECHRIRGRKK